jgi:NADPH2:quinone reductase
MRAYWYETAGKAADVLTLGEMDAVEPGSGEVRVSMACSAINPTDWKRRERGRELGQFPRIIPNNDGSGVIDAVGEGVDAARVGERVWLFGAQAMRPFGTAAETCILPARYTHPLPDNQSLEDGACLGVPAVTAHRGVFADAPDGIDGQTILITGGAGRVGRYAVQIAKASGATVITTAGSAEKVSHLADLGADHALNYRDDDIKACVMGVTEGRGVDRILDVAFGANIASSADLIRENGLITSYGSDAEPTPVIPFYEFMFKNIAIRPFAIFGMPDEAKDAAFACIGDLLKQNKLSHRIGARFDFADMIAANEAIETGMLFGTCVVNIRNV